jgi:glutathione S-transferase
MSAPVLWHISFSNFNEKARWALDYKRIAHVRREAPLGLHPLWARRLGGGRTFPLLVLDGDAIGDSTRIIEELGHEVRRVAMEAIRRDPKLGAAAALPDSGALARNALTLALAPMGIAVRRYYGVNAAAVDRAWELIGAAIDRFQAQLQPSGYLVGGRFSVADLTFAALIGSAVQPEGFPYRPREPDSSGSRRSTRAIAAHGYAPN